jgi:maleylacetoacetate isomerase
MAKAEHSAGSFKLLNPSGALPVLVVIDSDGETVLTQSIAILEYLEETGSQDQMALLPPAARPKDRAKVRELVGIIAADLFPPANSRVARLVRGIRDELKDQVDFVRQIMSTGFAS